jgi:N-(2-amino-2-carboxyethyl)-L-glutamate synthase
MHEGILSVIGGTPLIRLRRVMEGAGFDLFAKLESLNPGGSTKDRPAFFIIQHALETGAINRDTVVVESSSGNMGVGLAQACAYFGLRFVCVVDAKTTAQNILLLEAYGAQVEVVSEPDPETGEFLPGRLARIRSLLDGLPDAFWPNQYANEQNARAHHRTIAEVVAELKQVDYLFCATSTCGTLRGCAEYLREHGMATKVYAVDAVGSVIFGGPKARRLIPGHGAAVRPALYRHGLADACVHVTDLECVIGCRRLARREAIIVGGSSGGVLMALERVQHEIPPGAVCVMIFPDRGERYLDTIYSDSWVREKFGEVPSIEETREEVAPLLTATY